MIISSFVSLTLPFKLLILHVQITQLNVARMYTYTYRNVHYFHVESNPQVRILCAKRVHK